MILIFIIYCILILWLCDISKEDNQKEIRKISETQNIIINHLSDISDLLITIDSIKSQTYQSEKINLIIFDFSNEDIKSILNVYKNKFLKINVIKSNNFENYDHYLDLDESIITADEVLIIKSGMKLPSNTIQKLSNLFLKSNNSAILIPIVYRYDERKNLFFQLLQSFLTMIKFATINKGILSKVSLYDDCLIIKRNVFIDILGGGHNELSLEGICNSDIYINHKNIFTFSFHDLKLFYLAYSLINLLFIIVISMFINNPNTYLFLIILIKIIPEAVIIYLYYNKLKIKFPKIDFIIYLTIIPFYIFVIIFKNKKLMFR